MAYDEDILDRTANSGTPDGTYAGKIANTATALTDLVYVTVDGIDNGENKWGPCPWGARIGAGGSLVYPAKGNLAAVTFDDERRAWILNWTPY